MADHDPTGPDPAEHHEELIEQADVPPTIAAEAHEASQVEHEEAEEIDRLDDAADDDGTDDRTSTGGGGGATAAGHGDVGAP